MVNIMNIDAMLKRNLLNNKPYRMLENPKALSTIHPLHTLSLTDKGKEYKGKQLQS